MKQLKIALIAILGGFCLFMAGIMVYFINAGGFFQSFAGQEEWRDMGNYELVLEKEESLDGIKELIIDYGMNSHDVYLYEGEDNKVLVKEFLNFTPDKNQISDVSLNRGALKIQGKRMNKSIYQLGGMGKGGYVEIYLPASYSNPLTISTVSGEIISDMDLLLTEGSLRLSSTSGDIRLPRIESSDIKISTVSGEVQADTVQGDLTASSTSGDITVKNGDGKRDISTVSGEVIMEAIQGEFDISTTSGDVAIRDGRGGGKANTVSGEIKICLEELTEGIDAGTTSGDVVIGLPEDSEFYFDAGSISGDIKTFFDESLSYDKKGHNAKGNYGSGGNLRIKISTVSGEIMVREY